MNRDAEAAIILDEFQHKQDQVHLQLLTLQVEETHLKERRRRMTIEVPEGWKIVDRHVEPGEWVGTGQNLGAQDAAAPPGS